MKKLLKIKIKSIYNFLSDNVISIMNIGFIVSLIASFSNESNRNIWLIFISVLFVIFELLKYIINFNRTRRIPIWKEKLIDKLDNGDLQLSNDKLYDAITYLNMIEEYIDRNSLR